MHYDPAMERAGQRLWRKVRKTPGGCWIYEGLTYHTGYGRMKVGKREMAAHRLAYLLHYGHLPEDRDIRQTCREWRCVNPAHLYPAIPRGYMLDEEGDLQRTTHCKRGHLYHEENIYITTRGVRQCRECAREQGRDYYYRSMRQHRVAEDKTKEAA